MHAPVTYFQSVGPEDEIVAVFLQAPAFVAAFAPAPDDKEFPAIYLKPLKLTFTSPRTFSPERNQRYYHQVSREVVSALYPDHVRWLDSLFIGLVAIAEDAPALTPPPSQETLW